MAIPHDILVNAFHPILYPQKDDVTLFLAQIDVGVCLLYCDSLQELCSHSGVSPLQLSPNALRMLVRSQGSVLPQSVDLLSYSFSNFFLPPTFQYILYFPFSNTFSRIQGLECKTYWLEQLILEFQVSLG